MAYKMSSGKRGFGDIQFEDDADTGIDFEQDTIKLETAGNAVLVVSGSKVGIGTSNPSTTFHAYADASSAYVATIDNDAGTSAHGLKVTTDGTGTGTNILALEAASTTVFKVRGDGRVGIGVDTPGSTLSVDDEIAVGEKLIHRGDPNTYLQFPSNDNMTFCAGGSEELKITADDGTGDSAILVKQYIKHAGDNNTWINFTDNRIRLNAGGTNFIDCEDPGSAPHKVRINNGGNNIDFVIKDSSNNVYFTADASTARIGIGETNPSCSLHVVAEDPRVRVDATAGNHPGFELAEDGTRKWLILNDPANDNLVFKDSADRVVIKQGGNVGIGTDNPSSHLHIKDTGDVVITLEADSDNVDEDDNAYIEFKQDAANTRGIIGTCGSTNKGPDGTTFTGAISNSLLVGTHYATWNGSHYATPLQFACEGEVQMTINDGDVGIGVNVPTAKLDVNSNKIRLRVSRTITNSNDNGEQGEICWDSNYIYICVANNTWKRVAIGTW